MITVHKVISNSEKHEPLPNHQSRVCFPGRDDCDDAREIVISVSLILSRTPYTIFSSPFSSRPRFGWGKTERTVCQTAEVFLHELNFRTLHHHHWAPIVAKETVKTVILWPAEAKFDAKTGGMGMVNKRRRTTCDRKMVG